MIEMMVGLFNPKFKIRNPKLLSPAFGREGHFGLEVNAQRVRHAVDVVEIRNNLDGVKDIPVGQSLFSQGVEVARANRGRSSRHQHRESRQRFLPPCQFGAAIIVLNLLGQFGVACLCTEILPVRLNSIETVVRPGNDGGQ